MKKNLLNPGFEFVFGLGVIIMLVLPNVIMAQEPKDLKITILNHDTTVNGKNIKELSVTERKKALKDIDELKGVTFTPPLNKGGDDYASDIVIEKRSAEHGSPIASMFRFKADSTEHGFEISTDDIMKKMDSFPFNYDDRLGKNKPATLTFNRPYEPFTVNERKNSQSFNYSNTDNDGISTHITYHVSDANQETLKRICGAGKAELCINDLTLTPLFTSGKTSIGFSLPEKGNADIQFKNSEGKILWTDKTSGIFNKSFELPQNGIYYLQVKQNSKLALRRIVKEQ